LSFHAGAGFQTQQVKEGLWSIYMIMANVIDVDFPNGNASYTNCCPVIIILRVYSCRPKPTIQTPKRAQRACWRAQEEVQDRDIPPRVKNCRKNQPICGKNVIFNFQKNNMTQAKKEGKKDVRRV